MSIRKFTTFAIDCDYCDAAFADVVEEKWSENVQEAAIRAGWQQSSSEEHICPKCIQARQDALKKSLAAMRCAR